MTTETPEVHLIDAEMVYDYSPGLTPAIPLQMWPDGITTAHGVNDKLRASGQFRGTNAERLAEIAGRVCYDSFGKGRCSEDYHEHILEVKHGSVLEHYNFTVQIDVREVDLVATLMALTNRPGIWTLPRDYGLQTIRITLNMRAAVEWHFWTAMSGMAAYPDIAKAAQGLGTCIRHIAAGLAPNIVKLGDDDGMVDDWHYSGELVEPEHDEEKWVTMLITGSRGLSHELVRHGDRTAISQRSTRYVDENESPWVMHPLIKQYMEEWSGPNGDDEVAEMLGLHVIDECKQTYGKIVDILQPWLKAKLVDTGMDKKGAGFSARKQARGAARGLLGNALYTEVIFSASVAQWKRILRQRACAAADGEIRESFAQRVLMHLKRCRYADRFAQWQTFPCEDGIGIAAKED